MEKLESDPPPAPSLHHGEQPVSEAERRRAPLVSADVVLLLGIMPYPMEGSLDLALHLILDLLYRTETWHPFPSSLAAAAPPEEEGKGAGWSFACATIKGGRGK